MNDDKLSELRSAFDRAFAEPRAPAAVAQTDFLALRLNGDPYAVRLSEVASLQADRAFVRAPSLLPEFVGIAGFRTVLTPVYDLGALLGYSTQRSTKWLLMAKATSPIGFAFEAFDGHLRVPASHFSIDADAEGVTRGSVRNGEDLLPLIHLPSLVEGIARRIKALGPSQER